MRNLDLPVVADRLRLKARVAGEESAYMRAHAPGLFKITLPSPAHCADNAYRH